MRKIYYLPHCTTCQKVVAQLNKGRGFEMQNIKEESIKAKELDFLRKEKGSYEALFSRRAMKFRSLGLHEKNLSEKDYRKLILQEYTFLKRPTVVIDDEVFVCTTKKEVQAAIAKLKNG